MTEITEDQIKEIYTAFKAQHGDDVIFPVDILNYCAPLFYKAGFEAGRESLDDAMHKLLTECYGTISRLREDIARCRHQASYSIGDIDALKSQLNKVREIATESLRQEQTSEDE